MFDTYEEYEKVRHQELFREKSREELIELLEFHRKALLTCRPEERPFYQRRIEHYQDLIDITL